MKRFLKLIGVVLGVLVLLVVATAVIAPLVLNPNDFKDEIAQKVKNETGRDLRIAGDIGLSVFPWLGVDIGKVTLGNAEGFPQDVFASTDRMQVRVKLLPLLRRRVEMDTVTVQGLTLHLARNAGGATNWSDLLAARSKGGESGGAMAGPGVASLAVGGLDVRDATLTWDDASDGAHYAVEGLRVQTGAVRPDRPVELSIEFDVQSGEPAVQGHVRASGELALDPDTEVVRARGLEVHADLAGGALPGGRLAVNLAGDAALDQRSRQVSVSGLRLEVPGAQLGGLSADLSLRGDLSGGLDGGAWKMGGLQAQAELAGAGLPGGRMTVQLAADAALDPQAQTVALDELRLKAAGLEASGSVQASGILGEPAWKGGLSVARFSPRELLARLGQTPPETADPDALGAAELSATLEGTRERLEVRKLSAKLDDSTIEGSAEVADFAAPALRFDLSVDSINADRYLPPAEAAAPKAAAGAGAAPAAAAAAAAGALPLETLRALNVNGRLRVGKLEVRGVKLSDLSLTLKARDGDLRVSPASARLYDGSLVADLGLDARGREARLSVDQKLAGVQFGALLGDLGVEVPTLAGAGGDLALRADASFDPATQSYRAQGLRIEANVRGRNIPGGGIAAKLGADLAADLAQQSLALQNLSLEATDVAGSGSLAVSDYARAPRYSGEIKLTRLDPRALIRRFTGEAPKTADPEALSSAQLAATIKGTADSVSLNPVLLRVDRTNFGGSLEVKSFAGSAYRFDLALDDLDVDRYLPPPAKGEARAAPTPGAAATAAGELPVELLRALDVDGRLRARQLKLARLRVSDVDATVKAAGGVITLHPLTARLYEGSYSGNVVLDARGRQVQVSLDERLDGIQAGPLLRDLQGESRLRGRGDAQIQVRAAGVAANELTRNLNGQVRFQFRDGAIEGVNIGRLLREAKARLEGRSLPPEQRVQETDFSELSGTVNLENGVARNQDLNAKSPLLRVDGAGAADLVREQLDYRLTTTVVDSAAGQGGRELADLEGIPIPIRITGPFADPSYSLDLASLVKQKAKQEVQKKVQEGIEKKLGDKLNEPAKQILKGLFGN